ncbi:uncharacterized protein B0T23DRAFT_244076 [Neurospora hispaniola]|uniref:Uncharacterized protein n=1 Tax=Neurospora hispaniola TaxID=588809 RepID=A0AAJ0HZQ1_9PEZI|nr:hypothetical protein B0T23DRAFT_244076 [Neurospora hispaniola]
MARKGYLMFWVGTRSPAALLFLVKQNHPSMISVYISSKEISAFFSLALFPVISCPVMSCQVWRWGSSLLFWVLIPLTNNEYYDTKTRQNYHELRTIIGLIFFSTHVWPNLTRVV